MSGYETGVDKTGMQSLLNVKPADTKKTEQTYVDTGIFDNNNVAYMGNSVGGNGGGGSIFSGTAASNV